MGKKTPEHYRNPFLARAMVNVKMIDTQGYGIHTMFQKHKPISPEAVEMLKKKKLIEGKKGNFYVAKLVAQNTGQKVEYSKHKGLEDKKCEMFLLQSLSDHGSLTKREIVRLLSDVLPDQLSEQQKETKVYNILRKMKKAGQIYNESAGNKSSWFLVK